VKNFGSLYLTIHEDSFNVMQKWRGFFKRLYLEMNTDNFISRKVDVSRIGGFCIDLAHFKVEATKWSKEFIYIFNRRATKRYFKCNHLNGYSYEKNTDIHFPKKLSDFDYLKTLPKFVFGDVIALEMDNSISTQLKYKDYIVDILNEKFTVVGAYNPRSLYTRLKESARRMLQFCKMFEENPPDIAIAHQSVEVVEGLIGEVS